MLKKSIPLFFLFVLFFAYPAFAQRRPQPAKTPAKTSASQNENSAFENARNEADLNKRIDALQKFAADFPRSANRRLALDLIVGSRAQLANESLRAGDPTTAISLFNQAVNETSTPVSPKLFAEVIVQLPTNLFFAGQQTAAVELAKQIETKIGSDTTQLLALAAFYLGTENSSEARRIAEKVIAANPNLPSAYQTLGFSHRLDFNLEDAEKAYAKALELDTNSVVSKRSLAEMKRALGKSDESVDLYRQLVEKNPDDLSAQTGLTLAEFDAGKRAEAETLFNSLIEKNPANLPLLVGAAYWYAANNEGAKAIDLAQKAIAIEPRYAWAYIALARGLMGQNQPLEAERVLVAARQFGSFPTLDYELAAARIDAGFFQDAVDVLKPSFKTSDGTIETKLGRRITKNSADFIELLALERRASIFAPVAADDLQKAEKVKSLLILSEKASADETSEAALNQAINDFISGEDSMKTYRQLYAANLLLRSKRNVSKAVEITQDSIKGVDAALADASAKSSLFPKRRANSFRQFCAVESKIRSAGLFISKARRVMQLPD